MENLRPSESAGSNPWEKTGQITRMILEENERFVEIQWNDANVTDKKMYPDISDGRIREITDMEWDIFKLAFITGKPVTVKSKYPHTFENMKFFRRTILEVK